MLSLLGFTFSLLEIAFFSAFFILLLIGVSFDRRGRESFKWWVFIFGFFACIGWFWKDLTFTSTWNAFRTWNFWEPIVGYLSAGLIYSIVEFVFNIRREARAYKASWERALMTTVSLNRGRGGGGRTQENMTLKEAILKASTPSGEGEIDDVAVEVSKRYLESYIHMNSLNSRSGSIISLTEGVNDQLDQLVSPKPKINKLALSEHLGAWTIFWPFYMISLILDDLLIEIFDRLSDIFVRLSEQFVRLTFKDVFKL